MNSHREGDTWRCGATEGLEPHRAKDPRSRRPASPCLWCLRVEPDDRTDEAGARLHPEGYIAWCPYEGTRVIRVDFNLQHRNDGDLLLVVTAFEVTR